MARHGVCAPPPLQPGRCSSDRLGAQAATTYGKGLVGRLADQRLFGRRAARLTQAEEVNAKSKSVCKRRHESVLLSSTGTSHAAGGVLLSGTEPLKPLTRVSLKSLGS